MPEDSDDERLLQALFIEHLQLLIDHTEEIINRAEYFFCALPFAYCSFPYITGDGPFFAGYLLLGWRSGILTAPCPKCNQKILIIRFCGSVLSGSNSCTGYCQRCRTLELTRWEQFGPPCKFALDLRKTYQCTAKVPEEYEGFEFRWGGNGLRPARKTRLVTRQLYDAVDLQTLIQHLQHNTLSPHNPPKVAAFEAEIALKFDGMRTTD